MYSETHHITCSLPIKCPKRIGDGMNANALMNKTLKPIAADLSFSSTHLEKIKLGINFFKNYEITKTHKDIKDIFQIHGLKRWRHCIFVWNHPLAQCR